MNNTLSYKWANKILKRKNSIMSPIILALFSAVSLVCYFLLKHHEFAIIFIGLILAALLGFERNGFNKIIKEKNKEIEELRETIENKS